MNIKSQLLGGALCGLIPHIGFDTNDGAGGGGDAGGGTGAGQGDGNAQELTTEQKLDAEFDTAGTPGGEGASDDGTDDDGDGDESEGDDDLDGEAEAGEASAGEADSGEAAGGEADAGEASAREPTPREKELTARAEQAEADLAEAREAAEKAGISLDAAADEVTLPEEPDPSKFEYGEHDKNYIEAKAKYDAKMELLQEQATGRFKVEAAALEAKWTKNLAGSAEKYPDFDEVVVKGAADKKWPCPPVVALAIKDSDYGPDIAYELASKPDEAKRINALTPLEQAREFGRMEERHHQAAETAKRKADKEAEREEREKQPRVITKAPAPPKRQVRGTGGHGRRSLADIAEKDDFAAFDKAVDERQKNAGGPRQRARVT